MPINDEFSFKDFTDKDLLSTPVQSFNNTTIKGSCFYQQIGTNIAVFPNQMDGVIFDACNLDNVKIPPGNTVLSNCSSDKIKFNPADKKDWILNGSGGFDRPK